MGVLEKDLGGGVDCLLTRPEVLEHHRNDESNVNKELEEGDDGAAEEQSSVAPERAWRREEDAHYTHISSVRSGQANVACIKSHSFNSFVS